MDASWDGGVSRYHFQVTVTLNSDLVFRITVSRAYLILFELGIPNGMWMHLEMMLCRERSLGHCDFDLVSRNCIESGADLLHSLS